MKKLLLIFALYSNFIFFAQTGPGGVGNSSTNVLWVRADDFTGLNDGDNISTWTDASGNSNDLTQSNTSYNPVFKANLVNSYPLIRFNKNKNRIKKTNFGDFPSNEITAIYVNKNNGENGDGILSYATPNIWFTSHDNTFLLFASDALELSVNNSDITSTVAVNNNNWNIANISWEKTNGKVQLWRNGDFKSFATNFETGNAMDTGGCFAIGCDQDSVDGGYDSGQTHTGDFTEVILYNTFLNFAQHKIVSNYLSAKYNTTLEGDDLYTQDDPANGNFDFNVAGIGQTGVDSSNHTDSQGSGIIRINTPSALADSDFLFWGEDVKNANYVFTLSTQYTNRLDTKWRVSKFNDLGTVSVHVKQSDIDDSGKLACAPLKLIVSSVSDFSSKTSYSMTLSGGVYTATNVDFTDGDYFTLEYFDKIVVDGTKFYNGSGVNNVPNTTDICYKLLVKNTADGSLALTEDAHVREVEVETNGKLVINNGFNLEIDNAILNDGDIRLLGNSQLLQTHTGGAQVTGTGKLYMDRQSKLTNVYQSSFWSSPVSTNGSTFSIVSVMKDGSIPTTKDTTPPDITFIAGYDGATSPFSIARFWLAKFVDGGPTDPWDRHGDENTSYNIAEGYNMKSTGGNQPNYTFVGTLNDGDYTSAITGGNSSLLGNPYPSAMIASTFLSDNSTIFDTLYYWDSTDDTSLASHVRGVYNGGFATYKNGTGTKFNNGLVPNNIIPVGQAFFVEATVLSSGTPANIVFHNSQRTADNSGVSFRTTRIPLIRLGLSFTYDIDKSFHRQLAVSFRNASNNYDSQYDALISYMRPTDMSVKALDTTDDYVIKALANFSDDLEIPLHIVLDEQRDLTFMIDGIENVNIDNVYLKDLDTNLYYNLETPISINIEAGDYTDRFVIVFRNSVAQIDDLTNNNTITIIDKIDTVNIQSNQIIKEVHIFNTLGQLVTLQKVNSLQINIPIQNKAGQVLFIKTVLENGQSQTKKIIKK